MAEMESEQMMEWGLVRDRAISHLRHCHHIDISKHRPQAQLLILPSFSDTVAIDIVRSDAQFASYITYWRSSTDINAFSTPVERLKHRTPFIPTYESTQTDRTHDQLAVLLDQISQTAFQLSPTTNSISLDGTSFEFNSGNGYTGIRLRWHNQLPSEWSALAPVTNTMLVMAERDSAWAT